MNNSGFTLIELIATVAIIAILATVAVPMYGDVVLASRKGADDASVVVLNDATNAYAMLNGMTLDEVFTGLGDDGERMSKLVTECYLSKEVSPAQKDAEFMWNAQTCKWTVSDGADASTGDETEGEGSSGGDSGTEPGTGNGGNGNGGSGGNGNGNGNGGNGNNGNGGRGHGWRWRHGYGWQWYDEEGNQGDGSEKFDVYGYGYKYGEGTKVWYCGEYYISRCETDNTPGSHKDWQKICDEWFEYNTYEEGETVICNGKEYVAKKSSCGKDPEKKSSHWQLKG